MLQWAREQGIQCMRVGYKRSVINLPSDSSDLKVDKGIGLFASATISAIKEDEVLVSVPEHLLINRQRVEEIASLNQNQHLKSCLDGMRVDMSCGLDDRKAIMTFLLWMKFVVNETPTSEVPNLPTIEPSNAGMAGTNPNPAELWRPYMDILPDLGELDSPLFYDPESEEMALLTGTGLESAVASKAAKLFKEYTSMRPHLACIDPAIPEREELELPSITFEKFKWADELESKGGNSQKQDVLTLVPFIDYANHSFTAELRWHVGEDGSAQLRVTAHGASLGTIKAGTELSICYGDKPNSELLFLHGFALAQNPFDNVAFQAPVLEATMEEMSSSDHETLAAKFGLFKHLGLRPVVELRSCFKNNNSDMILDGIENPTHGAITTDSLLVLIISVVTYGDGMGPLAELQDVDSGRKRFSVDSVVIDTKEQLWKTLTNSSFFDILLLRAWTVLQSLVQERLVELDEIDETLISSGNNGRSDQRKAFALTLRHGHQRILVESMDWLSNLQVVYSDKPLVVEYLQSMQG
ncbi:N-lysine methyltransferase setd6 [Blyttiomyces sp. JEL0837]|nr:N-lysine methyltransferase setd6 [Blyttiomyces sp. JEL0837]